MKMNRRNFNRQLAVGAIAAPAMMQAVVGTKQKGSSFAGIRLGGPVYKNEFDSPETWVSAIKAKGYRAINCPLNEDADDATVQAYKAAAARADITIAEVGAWSNPICPDDKVRKAALEKCIAKLELADRIEARCCVNVSGSRGTEKIGAPHPDNLTPDTFDLIVETTRKIIDAVKPTRTYFALETMPCAYPDSVQSYLDLIKAIDRKQFAAHFDPVNLINSPGRYYNNAQIIRNGIRKLAPYLRSCHAKDSHLSAELTFHVAEVVPGTGNLDYAVYLKELSKLDNVPLMMEHMKKDEYPVAASYIRSVGRNVGIKVSTVA
ncbi:MAG: sugar phosphate isomerase/epimerase family protein [Puniceicoccaceae bacterium]